MNGKSIDKQTMVSLGLVIVLAAGIWSTATWMTRVDARLSSIETQLIVKMNDRWRGHDMRVWVQSFREMNPDLHVPAIITED